MIIFCAKKTKRSTLFNLYFSSVPVFNAHSGVCDVCDAAKAGVVETACAALSLHAEEDVRLQCFAQIYTY